MKHFIVRALAFCLFLAFTSFGFAQSGGKNDNPKVLIITSLGNIEIELYPDKAPVTAANFLNYVNDGFYDGTIFHRVIKGFMIQGGGFDVKMKQKDTRSPIKIESDNGLKNTKGTVAMARTQDPNSATSQFFINLVDNPFLDYKAPTTAGYGYAVFGKVTQGMDIVEKIGAAATGSKGFYQDVPITPIVIESVKLQTKKTAK